MRVKATMRYHLITTRMAIIIKKKTITSVGEDVEKMEPSCIAGGNAEWRNHSTDAILNSEVIFPAPSTELGTR